MSFVTVVVHPLLVTVYLIVAVPAAIPLTTPELETDAIEGAEDDQLPPDGPVKVVWDDMQSVEVPVIGDTTGIGITVTLVDCVAVPQLLVTVSWICFVSDEEKLTGPGAKLDGFVAVPS